jgi:futalosine hydrolase
MSVDLLVCAATRAELAAFLRDDEEWPAGDEPGWIQFGKAALAVTGVGIPATLLRLPPLLAGLRPGLVLDIGIAGAYPGSGLAIGDVVMASSEVIGDIGFELPGEPGFQFVGEAPFGGFYRKMPMALVRAFRHEPAGHRFREVGGCTVNACTGTARTGALRERLFGTGFESMEGAAVALACDAAGVPACELRAISNLAADRDMRPENIRQALANLRDYLLACRQREGI